MTKPIPELPHGCGSWVIVDPETGKGIIETFDRKFAESINQDKYKVMTAAEYLPTLNA